jgi:Protein of unknown function (DUF3179)
VWKSTLGSRTLRFHLAGINNQNFIMADEETGTWWQQVTGCALRGPLAGRCLEPIPWDEVTFAVWKSEHPQALVLLPSEVSKGDYASEDWEKRIAAYPTVTPIDPQDGLQPRDLVVGVRSGSAATAYPWTTLAAQNPIADSVGDTPVLILLHPDGRSMRCFDRRIGGGIAELYLKAETNPPTIVDSATGSVWDFSGLAAAGSPTERRLARVNCLKDYWFDWKTYNPGTRVFTAGGPARRAPGPSRDAVRR